MTRLFASFALLSVLASACAGSAPPPTQTAATTASPDRPSAVTAPARDVTRFTAAPKRVEKSVVVNAPPAEVWKLISDHQQMPTYFPGINHVDVDNSHASQANGVGCVRSCSLHGNMQTVEEVRLWEPPAALGYTLRAPNAMGLSDHFATVELTEASPGTTRVTWTQYFNHPDASAMSGQIGTMLDGAMAGLAKRFGRAGS